MRGGNLMTAFNRHGMTIRALRSQLWKLPVVIGTTVLLCVPTCTSRAAPVTLRFDATITHALAGNAFDLPFSYEVGDAISGKLTFEPGAGIPIGDNAIEADQFLQLKFVVGGTTFGTSTYSIEVFNDTAIEDSEPFLGSVDTMIVDCSPSSSQPCTPELITLPNSDPFSITSRLELTGDGSILDIPTVSAESEIWNSYTLRRTLAVTLDNESGGSMLIFANVGQFTAVPEPTSSFFTVWSSVECLLAWWALQRKRGSATGRTSKCFERSSAPGYRE
jgi:hypothetical protein